MRLLAILSLVAATQLVSAQNSKTIDPIVESAMAKGRVPGLALAVVRDGKVVYQKGYGFADIENGVRTTPETAFEIGSITKQFTAAIVLQLVEEGKVKLDETIRTYLPDLPELWKAVTVRHLLTHTSGIKSYTDMIIFFSKMRNPASTSGFLDLIGSQKLDFEPGSDWRYDNSGYFILGMLIEKVTGSKYEDNLQERICRPLGMTHTSLNNWRQIIKNRARGYEATPTSGPENTTYLDMGWPFAAGAMISTVGDMAIWDAALYTDKPVKQSSWKEAWTPVTLTNGSTRPYGFGWALGQLNGVPYIDHGGAINGFNAEIIRVPSKKLAVITMCNAFPGIAVQVARAVLADVESSLKPSYKPVPDPDPKRTTSQRALLDDLVKGKAKKDVFTDDMQARLFPAFAAQIHQLLGDHGEIESFVLVKIDNKGGVEQREYHVVIGGQGVRMIVATNSAGKIAGFSLELV